MITEEKIKRINELSKKSKSAGLDEKEKKEQKILRDEYVKSFRDNLKAQLDCIKVVDSEMETEVEEEIAEVVENE